MKFREIREKLMTEENLIEALQEVAAAIPETMYDGILGVQDARWETADHIEEYFDVITWAAIERGEYDLD